MTQAPIAFALWWHQHQPSYKDPVAGKFILPWVRLHAIKDYYGMARLIQQVPEYHCQINLVPSMVAQLLEYIEGKTQDEFQWHARIPAAELTQQQAVFLLDHFFMAQWDRMIRVHPGYARLLAMRNFGVDQGREALVNFKTQDLRDLQVWFNLTWFHETARVDFPEVQRLIKKGRDFTEEDKLALFAVERQVLARVLPLHRELQDGGQVELTCTPFYHPILPLLCDFNSCKDAMPTCPLPAGAKSLAADAAEQVRRAVEFHTAQFGRAPLGMWPSEGSVADPIVPILQKNGLVWFGTDEEILERSLGVSIGRSDQYLERPEVLYQPYHMATPEPGRNLFAVFRDRYLSDLIGFQYAGGNPADCAADLAGRIVTQGEAARRRGIAQPLVSIILDGENCWEHYEANGCEFLRELYRRTAQNGQIQSVKLGEWLPSRSAAPLPKLFAGSWINHDFYIWIGHEEDRKGWEWLLKVRADLERITLARGETVPPAPTADANLLAAWESLFVAEGSDWFWWYGDDHTSGNDAAFDMLFRTHLENVYRQLGLTPPAELATPIKRGVQGPVHVTRPAGSLQVVLDGKRSNYFEWLGAGQYDVKRSGGVMDSSKQSILTRIHYGPAGTDAGLIGSTGDAIAGPGLWLRMDFDRELLAAAPRPDEHLALHLVVRCGAEERVYSLEFPANYSGKLIVQAEADLEAQLLAGLHLPAGEKAANAPTAPGGSAVRAAVAASGVSAAVPAGATVAASAASASGAAILAPVSATTAHASAAATSRSLVSREPRAPARHLSGQGAARIWPGAHAWVGESVELFISENDLPVTPQAREIAFYVETFWKSTGLQRVPDRASLSALIPGGLAGSDDDWVI